MPKGKTHICPVCKKEFAGSRAHMRYCSEGCRNKGSAMIKKAFHKVRDEQLARYRESLARKWLNPAPWEGAAEDSPVYGNMIFL